MFKAEKEGRAPGKVLLKLDNLTVRSNSGVLGLKNFSLEVRYGEIVGVAGVDGNGQAELVEALIGLRKAETGRVFLLGEDITALPIRERIARGMAYIPDDRHKYGLILDYTVEENLILKKYYREPFSTRGLLDWEAAQRYAERVINEFDVRAGQGISAVARSLSGGNQQKAIVGREIDFNPELLLAVQPTRGLDVGAIEYIHRRLLERREQGKAVLLVSLELEEILHLSDRIAVVSNGELVGMVNAAETDENEVGLMMTGVKRGATA